MVALLGSLTAISVSIVLLLVVFGALHMVYKWMRSHDPVDAMHMANEEQEKAWDAELDRLDDKGYQTWMNSIQAGRDAEATALADGKSKQDARIARERAKSNYMKEMMA